MFPTDPHIDHQFNYLATALDLPMWMIPAVRSRLGHGPMVNLTAALVGLIIDGVTVALQSKNVHVSRVTETGEIVWFAMPLNIVHWAK
jgi:hypothetical protein